jgi:chorismate dehydratase
VALARILLKEKFEANPEVLLHAPDLPSMLERADAALIIGDPALRLDPGALPYHVYDLGAEWMEMTGLPMVFAVWAGGQAAKEPAVVEAFQDSCRFGLEERERIIQEESASRGMDVELVRRYLTEHIVCELGEAEGKGLELFLRYAAKLDAGAAGGAGRCLTGLEAV